MPAGSISSDVTRWLEANVAGAVGPFEAEPVGGGRSNLTFAVTGSDGRRFVVRRPPLGHVLATAHDMVREHRIIAALGPTAVPVPPALGLCTDVDVNGALFYVMGFVEGDVLDSPDKAELLDPATRGKASADLIDVLGRSPRRRRRRRRPRRPRPARRLRRAATQAMDHPVGELQDAGAAGDRGGGRAARRTRAGAAGGRRSPTAITGSATA